MPGRVAGTYPEFKYGESIVALGATGFAWNEADFVTYVADPAKFLKEKTGDKAAKSKMSFKLPKEEDARNVYAFIASLSPAPAATDAASSSPPRTKSRTARPPPTGGPFPLPVPGRGHADPGLRRGQRRPRLQQLHRHVVRADAQTPSAHPAAAG